MSPELVTAISSGVAALVIAASVFLTAWRTNRKVEDAADKLAGATQQQSAVQGQKLDEIHVLVNSRLSRALQQIATLQKQLGIEQEEEPE
jgi:hypothetical protein